MKNKAVYIALAVVTVLLIIACIFLLLPDKSDGSEGMGLTVDPNSGIYVAPEKTETEDAASGIAIPGWGSITIPANTTAVDVNLKNPSENEGNLPDYTLDNDERCKKEGYTFSQCADGLKLGGKKCPYGPYYSQCLENCPSGYQTCKEPYVGVGEPCNGKYASCECTPCETGYDYTEIPEGYVQDGDPCLNCDGKTKYKVKPTPCEGFMDCGSMGGATNAETCLSGETIKYDNCKSCPNLGTLDTCPSGSVCTYEDCSGLWYVTGCQDGYTDYCDYCAM